MTFAWFIGAVALFAASYWLGYRLGVALENAKIRRTGKHHD